MAQASPPTSVYDDPALFRFVGSMEGVPEPTSDLAWRPRIERLLDEAARLLPGVAMAGAIAFGASAATRWIGGLAPVPPALAAILLGLAITNTIGLPRTYDEGLRFCVQRLLRVGVALLGIRLSLATLGGIGLAAFPIVVVTISAALLFVTLVNRRLGLPARLGTLIAVGTAICGNSAIAAVGPAIHAKQDEVAYAVACVTLFGLVAMLVYPLAAPIAFVEPQLVGIFLGVAIHDTAQVAGAGLLAAGQMGSPEVLDTAAATKLLRNIFMIVVVPGAAWLHSRGSAGGAKIQRARWKQAVPVFVLGFVGLAALRTLVDLGHAPAVGPLTQDSWNPTIDSATQLSGWLLTLAMAGIGLGTKLGRISALGLRPLAVGLVAAVGVGCVAGGMILALAPWIRTLS